MFDDRWNLPLFAEEPASGDDSSSSGDSSSGDDTKDKVRTNKTGSMTIPKSKPKRR